MPQHRGKAVKRQGENEMIQKMRKKISSAASITEICLSVFILIITVFSGVSLVAELVFSIIGGEGLDYSYLFDTAIELIIAVEFVKMLSKHSMSSAIEVLVFVIAKLVIIGSARATAVDVLLFVLAFAVLFAIRKYLHIDRDLADEAGKKSAEKAAVKEMVYSADTPLKVVADDFNTAFPLYADSTVNSAVLSALSASNREISVGEKAVYDDVVMYIKSVKDGAVESVIVRSK